MWNLWKVVRSDEIFTFWFVVLACLFMLSLCVILVRSF